MIRWTVLLLQTVFLLLGQSSNGQTTLDNCQVRILVTIQDIPIFVLYESGKVIYTTDRIKLNIRPKYVNSYLTDSLSKQEKESFIASFNLDTFYYKQVISIAINPDVDDGGEHLLIYTNINNKKKTNVIYDFQEDKIGNIPPFLVSLFKKTYYYDSKQSQPYEATTIQVHLFSRQDLKSKRNTWSFDWQEYKKTTIKSTQSGSGYPMLLIDSIHQKEIFTVSKKERLISLNDVNFEILLARPNLPSDSCFSDCYYYLKDKKSKTK